jgi:YhcN/YlaJ family sporulation lipoprotein
MKYWLLIFCVISVLAGCGRNADNDVSPQANQERNIQVKQSMPPKKDIKNHQEVAERLAKLAASVPEVNKATCVVMGNTAIVGIDVKGNLDSSHVGTVKYSVAEVLRTDPYGVNAIVTADMDLYQRIQNVAEEVRKGHPISGFANELADIVGRIMPQIPGDIIQPDEAEQEARR